MKINPCLQLAPYIESFWVQEDLSDAAVENYRPTRVLPAGKIDLLFHFHDSFAQIIDGQEEELPRFYMVGQRSSPVDVKATGKTGIIIVSFHPWGAAPFFDLPLGELEEKRIELEQLETPSTIGSVVDQMQSADDHIRRVGILQGLLLKKLNRDRADRLIVAAAREMNSYNGNISIEYLSDKLGISRRQFVRRFRQTIGISPKKFANILRFQKAMFFKNEGFDWRDIAFECGYYDQSHFIKDIKQFTGKSPGNVLTGRPPTKLMQRFNHSRTVSHFYNTIYL